MTMKFLVATIEICWTIEDTDCPFSTTPEKGREDLKEVLDRELDECGGYRYISDRIEES